MGTRTLIGLGSNLGDRKAHLDAAVASLSATPGLTVRAVSAYHETRPVGGPAGQGAFLNAVACLESDLDPEGLLTTLHAIEDRAGRVRKARWGERTLDLDLLLHGECVRDTPLLTVPHPRMALRRFVLAPLCEVAPDAQDPMTRRTAAELLENLDRRPGYVALHGEAGPHKAAVFRAVVAGLDARPVAADDLPRRRTSYTDPLIRLHDDLQARAQALTPANFAAERTSGRWLVSDFFVPLDDHAWLRALGALSLQNRGVLEGSPRQRSPINFATLRESVSRALPPTFAVVLGGKPGRRDAVELSECPLLWPESEDPEAVASETLSACAATRA